MPARLAPPTLGQVFTPRAVADLALALGAEGLGPDARLLDPSCGDGVFLARGRARGLVVDGVEIDPAAAAAARAHGTVSDGDFLELAPPDERGARLYDGVVGNPPYVRQELLGATAKARFAARVAADFPDLRPDWLSARADLALAFVARALRFVRPGGRVCLVVSAALLDAGSGELLGELLSSRGRIDAVLASPRERWFRDAAVNAVILLVRRDPAPRPLRAARLRVPIADARVATLADLDRVADVRTAPAGTPLAPLLRAPTVWFAAAASPALVPLGELAEVRRGVTSGANDFFYLRRDAARKSGIEPELLAPLLRSPRSAVGIELDADRLPVLALLAPPSLAAHPGARRYIEARAAAISGRPTLAARPAWWVLAARPARLFMTKAYSARFVQPLVTREVVGDQRVYSVEPRRGVSLPLLAAALNGTLTALALESTGRASLGEGALEVAVSDAARLPVIDVRRVDAARVRAAFRPLLRRPMGDVFAEAERADRAALDAALLAAWPALAALGPELARGLTGVVTERLARAYSFSP